MIGVTPSFIEWLENDEWKLKEGAPDEVREAFKKYNEEYEALTEEISVRR